VFWFVLPDDVHWSTLIEAGVAVGTLVLAGVTAWMALETRKVAKSSVDETKAVRQEAEATLQQVELSRVQMTASQRPVLADVPPGRFVERWQSTTADSRPWT
jgi:hypothetical protein